MVIIDCHVTLEGANNTIHIKYPKLFKKMVDGDLERIYQLYRANKQKEKDEFDEIISRIGIDGIKTL